MPLLAETALETVDQLAASATPRSVAESRVETSSVVAPRLTPGGKPVADALDRADERNLVDERVRDLRRGLALVAAQEQILDLARLSLRSRSA